MYAQAVSNTLRIKQFSAVFYRFFEIHGLHRVTEWLTACLPASPATCFSNYIVLDVVVVFVVVDDRKLLFG